MVFSLCSDFIKFNSIYNLIVTEHLIVMQFNKLKSIVYKNSYLRDLIDKCANVFLEKILATKFTESMMSKKDFVTALPCLGKLSVKICTRISCIMQNKLSYCNLWFVFQTKCKIINFFTFKDREFHHSYALAVLINSSAVEAVLPVMAKLIAILRSM